MLFPSMLLLIVHPTIVLHVCVRSYPSAVYVLTHILVYVPTCILLLCMCLSIHLCMCPLFILLLCKCPSIYCCFVYFISLDFHLFLDLPTHLPVLFSISFIKSCLYHGYYFLCCLFLNVFTSFIVFILISLRYVKREIIRSVIDRSSEWIRHEVTC